MKHFRDSMELCGSFVREGDSKNDKVTHTHQTALLHKFEDNLPNLIVTFDKINTKHHRWAKLKIKCKFEFSPTYWILLNNQRFFQIMSPTTLADVYLLSVMFLFIIDYYEKDTLAKIILVTITYFIIQTFTYS